MRRRAFIKLGITAALASIFSYYYLLNIREEIILPRLKLSGGHAYNDILYTNIKNISGHSSLLTIEDLSYILWAAQGITEKALLLRAAPSAGARYPMELFIFTGKSSVENLDRGIYHYNPYRHALDRISYQDCRKYLGVDDLEENDTLIVFNGVYDRTRARYWFYFEKYVHIEVGHILLNVYLEAINLGIDVKAYLDFNRGFVDRLVSLGKPLLAIRLRKLRGGFVDRCFESGGGRFVNEVIARRRCIRDYRDDELTIDDLNSVLGILRRVYMGSPFMELPRRPIIHVAIGEVDGFSPGLYLYDVGLGKIVCVREGDQRGELFKRSFYGLGIAPTWIKEGKMCIVVSVKTDPRDKYNLASMMSGGLLAQILHLKTYDSDLASVTVGGLYEEELKNYLNLPEDYLSTHIIPIGRNKYG